MTSNKSFTPGAALQDQIPDGFVLVRRQGGADQKIPPNCTGSTPGPEAGVIPEELKIPKLMRFPVCTVPLKPGATGMASRTVSVRGRGAERVVKATICRDLGTASSSANTAFNTVYVLTPGSATEFASFAALFDEARCMGITVHIFVGCSTGASGAGPANVWAVAFDPANTNQYSAIEVLLAAQQRTPIILACDGTGSPGPVGTAILPTSRNGGVVLKIKVPSLNVENLGSSAPIDLVGNGWWAMTSGTPANAVVGYLKPLIEAIGTSGVTTIRMIAEYHMEFRSRT